MKDSDQNRNGLCKAMLVLPSMELVGKWSDLPHVEYDIKAAKQFIRLILHFPRAKDTL